MKVYIVYDRYENDEWFRVDYIGTDKSESNKKFKEKYLPEFLFVGMGEGYRVAQKGEASIKYCH